MKVQDTPKEYTNYYGLPINRNPVYSKIYRVEIKKKRKVDPIRKSKTIDVLV